MLPTFPMLPTLPMLPTGAEVVHAFKLCNFCGALMGVCFPMFLFKCHGEGSTGVSFCYRGLNDLFSPYNFGLKFIDKVSDPIYQ